jgi:hypothetical protein
LNRAHVHETGGSQFVNYHRGGNTVAAALAGNAGWSLRSLARRRIDDGEPCARLGRGVTACHATGSEHRDFEGGSHGPSPAVLRCRAHDGS